MPGAELGDIHTHSFCFPSIGDVSPISQTKKLRFREATQFIDSSGESFLRPELSQIQMSPGAPQSTKLEMLAGYVTIENGEG